MGRPPEGGRRTSALGRLAVAALTAAVALGTAGAASAHPALSPAFLEAGTTTRIVAGIPNERLDHATTTLGLSFPRGFTVVGAEAQGAWRPTVQERDVSWSGGRLTGEDAVDFALTLRASVPAGTYDVALAQVYDDGARVRTTTRITVLPASGENAPAHHYGRAIAAAAAGFVIVVGSLIALRLLRRRRPSG